MELVDLRHLLRTGRRRGWLILLTIATAGALAFVLSSSQDPKYSATATVLVLPGQTVDTNEFNALQASRSVAETYRLLMETDPVLERVITELDLPYGVVELDEQTSTSIVGETQIIEVSVIDGDPEQAALLATTTVEQFQIHLQEQSDARIASSRQQVDEQIAELEVRRAEILESISDLEASTNSDDPALQPQIDSLTEELQRVEQSLSDLRIPAFSINSSIVALSAQVEVAESARIPTEPFEPRPLFWTLVGLFAGLVIGIALVALLEFLDNTVKPEQNLYELTGAPVLATVSALAKLQPGGAQVFTLAQPRSSAAEAMRLLRTNLEFASASGEIHSVTVTSPGPGEGKSTITANMGVVLAQSGLSVVIVDADLRKPTQHQVFAVANDRGLTTLLTHPNEDWRTAAVKVALPGLLLVPSGPIPPNPSDLVSGGRFAAMIDRIKADVDLVIIDSPPILSASDALAIAAHTDGVVLVCRSHKTRTDALRHAAHSVHQGGIRLVGVVVNRQRGQHGGSYYGQYYGTSATQGD